MELRGTVRCSPKMSVGPGPGGPATCTIIQKWLGRAHTGSQLVNWSDRQREQVLKTEEGRVWNSRWVSSTRVEKELDQIKSHFFFSPYVICSPYVLSSHLEMLCKLILSIKKDLLFLFTLQVAVRLMAVHLLTLTPEISDTAWGCGLDLKMAPMNYNVRSLQPCVTGSPKASWSYPTSAALFFRLSICSFSHSCQENIVHLFSPSI